MIILQNTKKILMFFLHQLINNWINDVHESNLIHFKKVSETFKDRQKEIVNYFKDRQNSGFVEGINNKIKVTKRRC